MATATTSAVILPLLVLLLSHVLTAGATVRADPADEIGPDSTWIVEPPETGVAVRGKPYTIKCHSDLPNVTYRWMFNNRTLDLVKDSRRQILPDGSLHFNKVVNKKSSDAGSYRCIVQTPYGAVSSKTFTLLLAALHDFDESPVGVTVNSEASRSVIRFACHVNSIPKATIMWQKNEIPLSTDNRFITKVPGVLYIKQVNENDTGSYRCVAKNNLMNKTKFSEVGHLKVEKINNDLTSGSQSNIQPITIISPTTLYPSVKYVAEGDNVTFECAATGVPSPQLKWSFTAAIGNKQNTMLSNEDTYVNILSLTSVTTNSSGTYTCHVFQPMTGWPDYPHAQVFQLEVLTRPTITIRPETRSVPLANSIRLKCGVQGNPIPNTTWYLNGEYLKFYGRVKLVKDKQLLLVSNTVSTDSGIYQCFASNQYGTTWAGALITISSSSYEPAPPINISCRTLSPTQIQVFWQKSPTDIPDNPPIHFRQDSIQLVPSHSEDPLSSSSPTTVATDITNKLPSVYTIHYMITDGGEETPIVSLNHTIIVEKLKPYKNYTFYVRVYNRKSGSDQSEKVTCKTQDEAPQTVPDLNLIPLSPISLHVEWSAINANLALFGAITQYHVMWRRFGSASNYIQVLHMNSRQYTITGLKPGGQYEVQVLGATQNGLPKIDFTWNFVELPGIDPILPIPVLKYTIGQSLIKLSWSVDDWSNNFNFYKLMYRITSQTNQSLMLLRKFEPNIKTYAIHYTSDMDVYEILLNCVTENKEGESITRTIAVRLNMFSPPSQIEAVATSLHTVNVSWVPPDSEDLSSLLFIITYNPISNSQNDTSTTVFTELGVNSYELSGLKPYSLYEIKISVQDKTNRKSEFSQKIQVRTLQGVPGIVEQIEWHWTNFNTVHISWVEPIKSNGEIMGYYLSYTSELNLPPTTWQQLNVSRQKKSINLTGLSNDTRYFFMLRAATDAGFGPQSGIFSIEPMTTYAHSSVNSKQPVEPALYMEDEQLLGIVIGCVIGVICILICTTSIMIKRQCIKNERMRNAQQNTLNSDVAYCAQNLQPFTVDHVQHEESVPLNDFNYITRHMVGGRGRYSNNISGMSALPLLDHSNVGDHDLTNVHIIENPQCTVDVDVDAYDVDSLLSESAEGGAGTEESGCSDQLAKSQKGGDSSVADDGFHEHLEPNKILVG